MIDRKLKRLLTCSAVVGTGLIAPFLLPTVFWVHVFALIFIKIILSATLRQMLLTGLLNLSTVTFMGIGAYFSAILSTEFGISFWATMPSAGIICAVLALLLGVPLFRLKGAYFFIGTICFAFVVQIFFSNFYIDTFAGVPGFTPIARPYISIRGWEMKFTSKISYYYLCYLVMVISLFTMHRLEHTRYGQYWKAIGEADTLIESLGVDLFKHKMLNFGICSFFCGVSGAIYAPFMGIITPQDFSPDFMFLIIMYMVVGGSAKFWGPVLGVLGLSIIGELLRGLGQYELFCYGIILVLVMLFMPDGFWGFYEAFSYDARSFLRKFSVGRGDL